MWLNHSLWVQTLFCPHHEADMLGPSYISDFSSRGPTTDGRTKPDILAPGKYLLSAGGLPNSYGECDPPTKPSVGSYKDGVVSLQGTSMVRVFVKNPKSNDNLTLIGRTFCFFHTIGHFRQQL